MSTEAIRSQTDLGRRIAEAREDLGKTQAELAAGVGLDRTAIAKIEAGTRKVSATELVAVAYALDRPIDWFFLESPLAVVSRRRDPAVREGSRRLDLALEGVARDVAFLVDHHILTPTVRATYDMPRDFEDAENLARRTRIDMGAPEGPILELQSACERLGLLAFSLTIGPDAGDAAYVEVGDLGVALINGTNEAGRRRFSLAHELGHHLIGDAYEPVATLGGNNETERLLNAFAAHLLMPRSAVTATWNDFSGRSPRLAATAVAVRFRVSWTAACNQLRNLDLIDSRERGLLVETDLRKGEVFELGEQWVPELEPPGIPPGFASAVVGAYRRRLLTGPRTVELLRGTLTEAELPSSEEASLDEIRGEFTAIA
jgi:Zn-dependent peptidase ImmA (M78 family)/DNA-binding XRE family transcriptional regulator